MHTTSSEDFQIYLQPTEFIDSDSPRVIQFVERVVKGESTAISRAIRLFYAVRDEIYYDPYRIDLSREGLKASSVLEKKYGFCISKAILLAAASRVVHIPSRLGFADVKNHLTTGRLRRLMKSDIFAYHGYTELFLGGKWVKATPAFNLSLCEKFDVKPLEFDGQNDSIFHEYDRKGNRHMEYIRDHGQFADLPYEQVLRAFKRHYPVLFTSEATSPGVDFGEDALKERSTVQDEEGPGD